jgi:hypothetical protein
MSPEELAEHRRKRRNAKTYRYQKKRRGELKAELLAERGGRCEQCGYNAASAALEFHHRDAHSKDFQISGGTVSRRLVWAEAAKCDLLCANCHRARHIALPTRDEPRLVRIRRKLKERAVELLGGQCAGCKRAVPTRLFEFHHLDARTKEFSISADGITRRWESIQAELAKCVLACANCHREAHAGLRHFGPSLREAAGPYRAHAA